MLQRLFMALLIACLAVPAMATPLHCVPQAQAAMAEHYGGHHQPAPEMPASTAAGHDCIGCAAPVLTLPRVSASAFHAALPLVSRTALLIARQGTGPDTPPPRS